MARIRSIKPEFWTSEQVVECSTNARLLFIGLWNFCDDYGRHTFAPKQIKALIYPADDFTTGEIDAWLGELVAHGLIRKYAVNDKQYLEVRAGITRRSIGASPRNSPPRLRALADRSTTIRRTFDELYRRKGIQRGVQNQRRKSLRFAQSAQSDASRPLTQFRLRLMRPSDNCPKKRSRCPTKFWRLPPQG